MSEDFTITEPIPESPEPRTRSVRRPARGKTSPGSHSRSTSRKRPSKRTAPESPSTTDAIRGILQLPAAGFILVGSQLKSVPLMADGATILVHGGPFAEAIAKICEHDPRAMALLEKAITFGPYGEALALGLPIAAQFIRNHNQAAAPVLEGFGAVPPEQIIAAAELSIPVEVSPNGQRDESVTPPTN